MAPRPRVDAILPMMDEQTCYEWGELFASPWPDIVAGMRERATTLGLTQVAGADWLEWKRDDAIETRWVFVDDPSNIETIRQIYNDAKTAAVPACLVVVRQPDPTEKRGDIVFDIFRLSPTSYLWHFYRVYTPPRDRSDAPGA